MALDDLNKKLKEVEEALKRLTRLGGDATIFNTDNITNLTTAERILESIQNDIDAIDVSAKSTYNSFSGIVDELTRGRTTTQQIVKSTRNLFSISRDLLQNNEDVYKASVKQLKKQQEKAKVEFDNLKLLKQQSGLNQTQIDNINGALNLQGIFNQQLEAAVKEAEAIEESLGAAGAAVKALLDIPGLSQFSNFFKLEEVTEAMENMSRRIIENIQNSEEFKEQYDAANLIIRETSDEIYELNRQLEEGVETEEKRLEIEARIAALNKDQEKSQAKILKLNEQAAQASNSFLGKTTIAVTGLGKAVNNFASSLTDPTIIFSMLVKAAGSINKELVQLSKNLGTSYEESQAIRKEFSAVALASEDTFYNTTRLLKAYSQYVETLGFAGRLNAENAKAFASLTERIGVAAESAAKLQFFAESTGNDLRGQLETQAGIVSQVGSQFGVQLNQKQILDEIGKSSAYTLVQFKGSVGQLTEAVAQAKALGMTLEQVNKIAGSILNFEQSITNELKAELLIGRNINLERARLAALNNDQLTLMEEINREVGTFSDFTNLNRIQQEAYAEALGMSVNEMSDMLLMEQYRTMNAKSFAALNGEEALKRAEMLSTQERFNDAIVKLQGVVADLVEGPLGTMAGLMADILGSTVGLSAVLGGVVGVQMVKFLSLLKQTKKASIGAAIAEVVRNAFATTSGIPVIGFAIGAALAAGAAALVTSQVNKSDDMIAGKNIPSGYGNKGVMDFEKGSLTLLNNNDQVVAGTNLVKPVDTNLVKPTAPQSQIAMNQQLQESKTSQRRLESKFDELINATKSNKKVEMEDPFGGIYTS